MTSSFRKKYTSGPRYWNVPVLVNTGIFLVDQYCLKMWYLRFLERAGVIQKLTILERKNGLVLSNTRVLVSGTSSILFPSFVIRFSCWVIVGLSLQIDMQGRKYDLLETILCKKVICQKVRYKVYPSSNNLHTVRIHWNGQKLSLVTKFKCSQECPSWFLLKLLLVIEESLHFDTMI